MGFVRKYLGPLGIYFLLFLAGYITTFVTRYIPPVIYDYLCFHFPSVFVSYSPISQPEEYAVLEKWLAVASVAMSIFIVGYIAIRLDNKRFEYFIRKTEGFYRLPEALGIWAREFLLCDIIVAVLLPLVYAIPPYFIPERAMALGANIPFWAADMLIEHMGVVECAITLSMLSLLVRLLIIPHTLTVWRANWLTASVD
jgi:hypothetical protein